MTKSKKILLGIIGLVIVASAFGGGVFLGYSRRPIIEKIKDVINKEPEITDADKIDFAPFWSAWNIIDSKFIANGSLDKQKMVWGAIAGMAQSLDDPYSVFFPPKKSEEFKSEMQGNFQGVGMEIGMRDNILTVVAPLKGTPAERAGIMAGDKILKVDEKTTIDMSVDQAISLIRGEKGTSVKLTILHKGAKDSVELTIVRDVIQIPVIETEKKGNDIFVIKLYSFTATSPELFRNAVGEFAASGRNKLILDLRGNPGGFLESAVDIASWFLPLGKPVAKEKFGDGKEDVFYSNSGKYFFENLPFVILVNEGSASASEILAGAMQDYGLAKIVGQKTFGKGSVQELVEIPGGGSLKITIAKWFTPKGRSISEKGIDPDFIVEMTAKDIEAKRDPQMNKAMELLDKWK